MIKAVSPLLGFILLLASAAAVCAQSSATTMAVNESVLRQANTIVLRQKLVDARAAAARGDLPGTAKLYEDAYALAQDIDSGIDAEKAQATAGLVGARLQLARLAQGNGDLHEADVQVSRALRVDPQNPAVLAFKKQNDQMMAASVGRVPDAPTIETVRDHGKDLLQAATLVQDGKLLYEAGKLEDAQARLEEALKLDQDNQAAFYYFNLIQQALIDRQEANHANDTQKRMETVEQQWVKPSSGLTLPTMGNPWALTNLVHTGAGREIIDSKLDRIRIDSVSWPDGLPLSEVIKNLIFQAKQRDPDKKGINFLWASFGSSAGGGGAGVAAGGAGGGRGEFAGAFVGGGGAIDPATGLPVAAAAPPPEVDENNVNIKLTLTDVSLKDLIDAITLVADHPIKYTVQDYAIVFSPKGDDVAQLYTKTFRVNPNTFFQGLQGVTTTSFGSVNSNSGGGGGGNGGGGGGNFGGGGNNGGNNNNNNNNGGGGGGNNNGGGGNTIAMVNVAGGGGGGGGGNNGGNNGGGGRGGRGGGNGGNNNTGGNTGGGLNHVTSVYQEQDVSLAARTYFQALGVDLTTAGKSIFFNDRLGLLTVRGTMDDLDVIESAIETLNQVPPQIHIKARFIEVSQDDNAALGFDWYLGNFINGSVVANGGSAPSLTVPVSAANPLGTFPGNTAASQIAGSATDQLITGGLQNSGPALATITGILTDPNFRVVLHALQTRSGFEDLSEPEVTTISGRQTEMKATQLETIITDIEFEQGNNGIGAVGGGGGGGNAVP